jgi:glycosyltransferase involved in cell wall biosynthesis
MKPHIAMLAEQYDVTLVANGVEQEVKSLIGSNIRFVNIPIERKIHLGRDLVALYQLYRFFREERFDVVHSLMPKAALLAMLAAFVAKVPNRIHTFTGQVWANKHGAMRFVLKAIDRFASWCATGILTDSFSQREFLIAQQVVKDTKIIVLANGSVCGVDILRFKPNSTVRHQIRSDLGIAENAIVYLFLGRLNLDKGIHDLAKAFVSLASNMPHIYLLVVGPDEGGMDNMLQLILDKYSSQFRRVGFTDRPEDYMASSDIFCLPSYREGFGSVIIEAAAAGIPAVASNIYGLVDSVKDGETGILHQPKNIEEIKQALLTLTNNTRMREKMSNQAMARAHELFATDILVQEMSKYYHALLNR